jgi:hypothetical protein
LKREHRISSFSIEGEAHPINSLSFRERVRVRVRVVLPFLSRERKERYLQMETTLP